MESNRGCQEAVQPNRGGADHRNLYEAVCSCDLKKAEEILKKWENNEDYLEDIISKVYNQVMLNITPMSDEMELFLAKKLVDIRFFSGKSKSRVQLSDITERAKLIVEIISELTSYRDNDEKFIVSLTFIAKQMHVLKRLLKSTYDRLPWEELEFCLLSFIRSYSEQNKLNVFYQATLNKHNILKYLKCFCDELMQLQDYIREVNLEALCKLPNLKRSDVIRLISANSSEFKNLYHDHGVIRDIYSLNIISKYVEVASSVDPKNEYGRLAIIRALQMIAEHLKNTLESPNLSETTSSFLVLHLNENTRDVIILLKNSLSHSFSTSNILELQTNIGSEFFIRTQNDVKKIGYVLDQIFLKNKIELIKSLAEKFINSEDVETLKEIASVLGNIDEHNTFLDLKYERNELLELRKLIEQLRLNIPIKTSVTDMSFERINSLLKVDQHNFSNINRSTALATLFRLPHQMYTLVENSTLNRTNAMKTVTKFIKSTLKGVAPKLEPRKFSEINKLLGFILKDPRLPDLHNYEEIMSLALEINQIAKVDVDSISWIGEFQRKLILKNSKFNSGENKPPNYSCFYQLTLKLSQLESVLGKHSDNTLMTYSMFKKDIKVQALIEMLVFEITSIIIDLEKSNCESGLFFLDNDFPSLLGKNLSNHLAHNNVLVEVLFNPTLVIYLCAEKFIREGINCRRQEIGKIVKYDYVQLKKQYIDNIDIINKKQKMFSKLREDNFDQFKRCIVDGADVRSRLLDKSTCLHSAAEISVKFVKYLREKGLNNGAKNYKAQTPLHISAAKGNVEVLKYLLEEQECEINAVDQFRRTPLHLAAYHGQKLAVHTLMTYKADLFMMDCMYFYPLQNAVLSGKIEVLQLFTSDETFKTTNKIMGGLTTLHIAVENGLLDIVQFLLKNVEVDVKSLIGATSLDVSTFNGHLDVAKTLNFHVVNVNSTSVNNCTPLHFATEKGYEEIVEVLLQHGANVDIPNNKGKFTPLHYAAIHGYLKIVEILLRYKAKVNGATADGCTALHLAAENNQLEVVNILLRLDEIDINKRNFMKYTPLHIVAENGDVEIAKLLIQKGAMIYDESFVHSPLYLAAKNGNEHVVHLLVKNGAPVRSTSSNEFLLHAAAESENVNIMKYFVKIGADMNGTDPSGSTCLHIAARNGMDIAELSVQNGIDINSKNAIGSTALHLAVLGNHRDVVQSLIAHGADVNSVNNNGDSVIHLAASFGYGEIIKLLIDNMADLYIENEMGETPLCLAIENNQTYIVKLLVGSTKMKQLPVKCLHKAISDGNKIVVKILLSHFPHSISQRLDKDITPLHLAVLQDYVDIVSLILEKGAEVNGKNYSSPLHLSVQNGNEEILEMLLNAGADINVADIEGLTPLHIASRNGFSNIVKVLLDRKAEANILDRKRRLPVDFAVAEGHLQICKLLLDSEETDINRKGNNEYTMLHIAAQLGHSEIVEYLIQKGADIHSMNDMHSKAIHIAAREGFLDIMVIFFNQGMSINERGSDNNSLLHYATTYGKIDVIKYLINQGFDVNSVNIFGSTALHIACGLSLDNVVKCLLNAGSIYNLPNIFDRKPQFFANNESIKKILSLLEKLFTSIKLNSLSNVEKLIEEDVVLNARDMNKGLPLHFAVYKGFEGIVTVLLRHRALPNLTFKNGLTALHYAAKYSRSKIVVSLLSHGAKYNAVSDTGKAPIDFASEKSIVNLLKWISTSFDAIRNGDVKIVSRLEIINDTEIIKAIMNARNIDGETVIISAIRNNFSEVERLKCISQPDLSFQLKQAALYIVQGNYHQALDIYEKVYQTRRDLLGDENPGTLDIRTIIADILYKQKKYHRALTIYEHIHRNQVEVLGANEEHSLITRSKIALVLHRLGENKKSLNSLKEIHRLQRNLLGGMHRDLLDTQLILGLVLNSLGHFEEALKMNYETLKDFENTLGPLHPIYLSTKNNVAMVLSNLGKYDEALHLFQEVYESRTKVLGPFHSDTLRCQHKKIELLKAQGKRHEVEDAYRELLNIQKQYLGSNHQDTVSTAKSLENFKFTLSESYDALKMFMEYRNLAENYSDAKDMFKEEFKLEGSIDGDPDLLVKELKKSLCAASENGDLETIKVLLESGVEADAVDKEGRTPLHFAVEGGNTEIINILLKNGANVAAATVKGNTALHIACSKNSKEVVEILLTHSKARNLDRFINIQTAVGQETALHIAAENGCADIVETLLRNGAIYNMANKNGQVPWEVSRNKNIVKLLKLIEKMFRSVVFCNFGEIFKMIIAMKENELECVVHAHNVKGVTVPRHFIGCGQAELARLLFNRLKLYNGIPQLKSRHEILFSNYAGFNFDVNI